MKAIGAIGVILALSVGFTLLGTWILMLVLGWVSTFLTFVPALSFVQTFGVVMLFWALRFIWNLFSPSKS